MVGVLAGLAGIKKHHISDQNTKDSNNNQTKGQNKSSKEHNSSENTSPSDTLSSDVLKMLDELKSGVNRISDKMKKDFNKTIEEMDKFSDGSVSIEVSRAHFKTLLGEVKKDLDKLSDSIDNIKSKATANKPKSRKDDLFWTNLLRPNK